MKIYAKSSGYTQADMSYTDPILALWTIFWSTEKENPMYWKSVR